MTKHPSGICILAAPKRIEEGELSLTSHEAGCVAGGEAIGEGAGHGCEFGSVSRGGDVLNPSLDFRRDGGGVEDFSR